MKSIRARGAYAAIGLVFLASSGWCQDAGMPSLMPLPPLPAVDNGYLASPAATKDALWGQAELSPVQTSPIQSPMQGPEQLPGQSVLSPDYTDAMKGGYESYGAIAGPCGGSACCNNHYVYANALIITHVKQGGFVTSVDAVTGAAQIFFCQREFGHLWHGGFEVGTGWCFGGGCGGCGGCGCRNSSALEVVYWGIFPGIGPARSTSDVNSTIDFSALDYNGANANVPYTGAQFQQVDWDFSFNSVEANLVGNCNGNGPFGCGMCGCAGCGSPWGFGWTAGFRWINLSDRFLFSTDPVGTAIDGEVDELNYAAASNNNLYGFQIGSGLSYNLTNRLTAFVIGKMGIYNNHVSQLQKVYGSAGTATVNMGAFFGQEFDIRSERDVLAVSGQFDLGGNWNVTDRWAVSFGYRVLGLAGMAIAETQVRHDQFHNVDGIARNQTHGNFLMHGAYTGVTYCW